MLYNEFIENVGCRDNEFNYNVYKELEIIYMNTDCSKSHIYEMGKKLVNNEEPDNVKEIKNKIYKLKDDLKYNKKLLNDYKNLYKESNDELRDGMVIKFHGANVIVFNVKHFDIKPYDDEALQILGNFYAYGNYGGAGFLEVPLVKEKAKTKKLTKEEVKRLKEGE